MIKTVIAGASRNALLAMTLLLCACAPQSQEYREPGEARGRLTQNAYVTHDEVALPMRAWSPKNPRAVIVALHGFNDYSRAFEGAGEYFKQRGIATYAYDQRGFGAGPQTGIWADERNLTTDLAQFVSLVRARHPTKPVYVMGESMGGAVAIVALAQPDFPRVNGVILVAPAVWGGEAMSPFLRASSWLMAHTLPFYTMTGSNLRIRATDNIELLRQMSRDPLIIKATRADAIYGLIGTMGGGYEKSGSLRVPVLLLYGEKDQVIPRAPVESAAARMRDHACYQRYPNGYHMLLRDLQGEAVLKDIAAWIRDPKEIISPPACGGGKV